MKTPDFKTIRGTNPILLSAPHVYPHKRPSLSTAYKIGEGFTDTIVQGVCKDIEAFGIVQTQESDLDFNFHKEDRNPYKAEVRKIVEGNDIEVFVDIHGLSEGKNYDIAIYYPTKFSKSIRLARAIKEGLDKAALRRSNIVILRFPEDPQEALAEFVPSDLRIPGVQIEIARYMRERENLREAFIQNLGETLQTLEI